MRTPRNSDLKLPTFTGDLATAQVVEDVCIDGLETNTAKFHKLEATNCVFRQCRFVDAQFVDCSFLGCQFDNCDLSNAGVAGTHFDSVLFTHCKLIGINWGLASRFVFDAAFESCNLRYGSFRDMKLQDASLIDCAATDCSFADTNLRRANFRGTDLLGSQFSKTDLREADLREAVNYWIDPQQNLLKGARVSYDGTVMLAHLFGLRVEDE